MLRYLAAGYKDFSVEAIDVSSRFNWEFYANLRGQLRPSFYDLPDPPLSGPTLWVFPPETLHGWVSEAPFERVVFHFPSVPDAIREACREPRHLSSPLRKPDITFLRNLAASLQNHYRNPTPVSLLLFERALIDLSLILLREHKQDTGLPLETLAVERVERAVDWYLAHLHERPTLDALAAAVHISPAHLRRQFRLVHGRSPHEVFMQLRLDKAAGLLAGTDETLDVIAPQCGFNSTSDFCRAFRRHYKVYPNTWRTWLSGLEQDARGKQLERLIARSGVAAPSGVPPPAGGDVAKN
ncbi:hypothetical protein OPIT5_20710 [Opitutaceae bacterium TAV5]|nr:hypothetical protein OPIT5_20710 [Opitutaceae bacterium TAV5]